MENRIIWKNGDFLPEKEAVVSIYDAGMMYGTIFEMTRSFKKVHFKLKEHLERLFASAKYFNINISYSIEQLVDICNQLLKKNIFDNGDEHRLLINVSSGALSIYKDIDGIINGTNIIITDFPLHWTVRNMGKLYDEGLNLMTPSQQAIPSKILSNRAKHHNRLPFLRANMEVAQSGIPNTWALLLDNNGFLTECVGANVFLIKDGILYTPKTTNILAGISRKYVMTEVAKNLYARVDFPVIETDLTVYDAINSDEMFVCATPFCILPVTSFNGSKIGDGKPGKITNKLLDIWSYNVGVNIPEQIKKWNEKYKNDISGSTPYQFTKKT